MTRAQYTWLAPLLLLLLLGLGGCGGDSAGGDADMAVGPDLSVKVKPPDMRVPTPQGCVQGTLEDENGGPLTAMTSILACSSEVCLYGKTLIDGSFKICGLRLRKIAVKTEEDLTATPRRAAAMCPVQLTTDGQTIDVSHLIVPLLGAGADLTGAMDTPQTLAIGDGLSLTLVQKDYVPPLGFSGPANVAARLVPSSKHCPLTVPDGGSVLAVYALSPFTAGLKASTSKFSFKATLATTANAEVHFWSISELDGSLAGPAIGHADGAGATVSTDDGQGLDELSWLVISR